MKVISKRALISSMLTVSAATWMVACGDKESDPDPITLADLKTPMSLRLTDMGDGSVVLTWTGSNNEDDFDGYNIYGAKVSTAFTAAKTKAKIDAGDSISLSDATGEADANVKAFMEQMSYNGKDFETPAAKVKEGDEVEYYPVYSEAADKTKLLPSCRPAKTSGSGVDCSAITTANQETLNVFNGETKYTVKGLKAGSEYCFAVFSSMDKGEEISATSSPLRCITPKTKATLTITGVSGAATKVYKRLTVNAGRTAFPDEPTTSSEGCKFDTATADICIETIGSSLAITSTAYTAILDAGYVKNGFIDTKLPETRKITKFDAVQNENGYNINGQSLALAENHLYVVAVSTSKTAFTSFHYDYYYVTDIDHTAGTVTFEVRLSNKADN